MNKKRTILELSAFVGVALLLTVMIVLFQRNNAAPKAPVTTTAQMTNTTAATTAATTKAESTTSKEDAELMILVNYQHEVPDSWKVDLVDVPDGKQLDQRAAGALKKMLSAAKKAGVHPVVRSAYRSKSLQKQLYDRKINQYRDRGYSKARAEELASGWVAYPGTSEHQLGLAADIVDRSNQVLDESQENTKTQKWLMKNAHRFGFILRYPNDKKEITHINYEPWHYRYVGVENAKKIYASGLCLEEYLDETE